MLGEIRIERGRRPDAAVVVLDHLFERGKATIVHIRRGDCDVAQGRNAELSPVGFVFRHRGTARIGVVDGNNDLTIDLTSWVPKTDDDEGERERGE